MQKLLKFWGPSGWSFTQGCAGVFMRSSAAMREKVLCSPARKILLLQERPLRKEAGGLILFKQWRLPPPFQEETMKWLKKWFKKKPSIYDPPITCPNCGCIMLMIADPDVHWRCTRCRKGW